MKDNLPSHVRVVMGADLEYKCQKIVSEEAGDGYLLFKTSCGITYSEQSDTTLCIIVLAFRRCDEREARQVLKQSINAVHPQKPTEVKK